MLFLRAKRVPKRATGLPVGIYRLLIVASVLAVIFAFRAFPGFSPAEGPSRPIDLNSASPEEIETLPSVGPKLAREIVAYRERSGPFKDLSELRNVPGVGPKTYARLARYLSVENGHEE